MPLTAMSRTMVAAAMLLAPSLAVAFDGPAVLDETRLTGRVLDPATGAGIAGAQVVVRRVGSNEGRAAGRRAGSPPVAAVATDTGGRFAVDLPAPGSYSVTVQVEGFDPSEPTTIVVSRESPFVYVELQYRLWVSAEVRGRPPASDMPPAPAASAGRSVLDARSIALAAGALEDPFRALQHQPGASPSNDDRNDVLVRGGGAIETATRIDGFDVPNPSHFGAQGGSGGGLSIVSPWVIQRASFQAGGFSVQHGERASAVIELTLRGSGAERFTGTAGAGVGGLMAMAEGPLGNGRGSWMASVRRSFLELVIQRGEARAVPRYGDAVFKIEAHGAGRHRLAALVIGGMDDVDARSGTDSGDALTDHQRLGVAGFSVTSRWSPGTTTTIHASFGTSEIDARMYDDGEPDGLDRSFERELRVRGEVRRTIGAGHEMLAGVALKRAWLTFDLQAGSWVNEYGNLVKPVRVAWSDRLLEAGGYAELALRLRPVTVTGGLRTDRAAATGSIRASPRFRVDLAAGSRFRANASGGVYRQAIPYIWIGSHPSNRGLEPIASRQVTAGAELLAARDVRASIEVFDKRYRNYPVDPVASARVLLGAAADFESPFVGELDGGGRVRARGFDAALAAGRQGRLEAALVYSLWRVTQAGLDGVWRPADYDVSHQGRLSVRWPATAHLSIGASWRYATGRPYTPFDPDASRKARGARFDHRRINAERYPPYHRLDVRADWRMQLGRVSVVAFGEVDNVYDRNNVLYYEWNRRTRTSDPTYQWGLMPVAGVRVEF